MDGYTKIVTDFTESNSTMFQSMNRMTETLIYQSYLAYNKLL
jgi:hypothetical protein